MSAFPGSPRILKGGLVLLDADSGLPVSTIALQYNPETLSRTLQAQGMGEGADRSEALRLKGPAIETFKLDAELDLTDAMEAANDPSRTAYGLHPQIAAIEAAIQPRSATLTANNILASLGTLEIIAAESPLAVFVWGPSRVTPVRITDFSVTEEAFDTGLNPIRAKISLGLRVLSVSDVGFAHRAGTLFMAALQARERLAALAPRGGLTPLGIDSL